MTDLIKVTPELLEQQAKKLDGQTLQYVSTYTKILQAKDDMMGRWSGETNQSYCRQLEGFRNDFEELAKLFRQYADYIRYAAARYRETEQTLAQEARAKLNLLH